MYVWRLDSLHMLIPGICQFA